MHFAKITNQFSVIQNIRLPAGMQEIFTRFRVIDCFFLHTDAVEKFFHNAFHCEEISVTVHTERELHPFVGQLRQRKRLWQINIAQFIKTYILIPSVIVRSQTGQHTV